MKKYLYPFLYIILFFIINYLFQYYIFSIYLSYILCACCDVTLFFLGRSFNYNKGKIKNIIRKIIVVVISVFLFIFQTRIIVHQIADVVLSVNDADMFIYLLFIYLGFIF